jgi:hypothetical protein
MTVKTIYNSIGKLDRLLSNILPSRTLWSNDWAGYSATRHTHLQCVSYCRHKERNKMVATDDTDIAAAGRAVNKGRP